MSKTESYNKPRRISSGITIADVARLANVSRSTVSRVINSTDTIIPIAEATRKKVMDVAKELNYQPSYAAKVMSTGRFMRIGCVVFVQQSANGLVLPANLPGYLEPAVNELAKQDYSLIYEPFQMDAATGTFVEPPKFFASLAVDGLLCLLLSGDPPREAEERIRQIGVPVVWINRNPASTVHNVTSDEITNGRLLARHLLELGHRRIAYAGSMQQLHHSGPDRFEGVRLELAASGLDVAVRLKIARSLPDNLRQFEDLLAGDLPITAIICYNRFIYDALLEIAMQRGLQVPRDLSLCYFASAWERPTAVHPPTLLEIAEREIAVTATRILLDIVQGKPAAPGTQAIAGKVHLGWSTGRPPG